MTDFKAKIHQNRYWLGLSPNLAGGAYSTPPDPGPTSNERGWCGRGREEREGKTGEGRRREGSGGASVCIVSLNFPQNSLCIVGIMPSH